MSTESRPTFQDRRSSVTPPRPARKPLIDLEYLEEVEQAAGFQPWPGLKANLVRLRRIRERKARSRLWRLFYWVKELADQ